MWTEQIISEHFLFNPFAPGEKRVLKLVEWFSGHCRAFRILGLGERKGRWAMEQDFNGDFQVNVTRFFAPFSGVLDWIVLILVWFERSLHSARVSGQSCPWTLKLMTSQRVERTWIRTGGYGRFRGEWVKEHLCSAPNFHFCFGENLFFLPSFASFYNANFSSEGFCGRE